MSSEVAALWRDAERRLEAAGVATPAYDARVLLAHVLGSEPALLPLLRDPTDDQRVAYADAVGRREQRVPLQHILGYAEFGGLRIPVREGVFTPRPETELVVDAAVRHLRARARAGETDLNAADLCSGTGAIAFAVMHQVPRCRIAALDADPMAVEWANEVGGRLGLPVFCALSDVTDPDDVWVRELQQGRLDVVTCNPPYVPTGTPVDRETAEHDPGSALWGGSDGLGVIRRVLPLVPAMLRRRGLFALEHDESHAPEVLALLAAVEHDGRPAFTAVTGHDDLAGRPRYATARRT